MSEWMIFEDEGKKWKVPADVHAKLTALVAEKDYLDRRQYNRKIQMNSMYGALANAHFRYFDPRMANSTTATGRQILGHMAAKAGEYFIGSYEYPNSAVIAGDTDSVYVTTKASNAADAIYKADDFGRIVNASFPAFMKETFHCRGDNAKLIKAAREVVGTRAIYCGKKTYMIHVIDKKGRATDDMKIMGLQIKKTSVPKHIQQAAASTFERYVKTVDWARFVDDVLAIKTQLAEIKDDGFDQQLDDPMLLGLPKTVKDIEKYNRELDMDDNARLPGHVAAAVHYNLCLKRYKDNDSPPITNDTKVKLFYLKTKIGRFRSIAVPTDAMFIPNWFTEIFVPLIDVRTQITKLVDGPISQVAHAVGRRTPQFHDKVIEESFEF